MICVVTGASSGVGKAAALRLAERGANVIIVCKNRARGETARDEILARTGNRNVDLKLADFVKLDEVRGLAEELKTEFTTIDVLINNAGVYRARREITVDGFETTMAVNHLAHFLLTNVLIDRIAGAAGRIVNVSSEGHRSGKLTRAPLETIIRGDVRYRGFQAYGDSKLANILFTFELARRFGPGVTANALHPGVLATRIWNQNNNVASLVMRLFKPFMGRARIGGEAAVRLALDSELEGVSGKYFDGQREAQATRAAYDRDVALTLWRVSSELVGLD